MGASCLSSTNGGDVYAIFLALVAHIDSILTMPLFSYFKKTY